MDILIIAYGITEEMWSVVEGFIRIIMKTGLRI